MSRGASTLILGLAVASSLALHVGLAFWLSRAEAVQLEGARADLPVMEVAFLPTVEAVEAAPAAPEPELPDPEPPSPEPPSPEPLSGPAPEPEPEPKPAPEAKPIPLAKTKAPTLPEVKAARTEKPKQKPKPRAEAKTPEAKKVEAKKAEGKPAEGQGAAKPKAAKAGGNQKWASKIRSKIERRKKYPAAAKGASGAVTVMISIAASGALSAVSLGGSSGNAALDAAALKAVQAAAPFPAAPEGQGGAQFALTMVFSRG